MIDMRFKCWNCDNIIFLSDRDMKDINIVVDILNNIEAILDEPNSVYANKLLIIDTLIGCCNKPDYRGYGD